MIRPGQVALVERARAHLEGRGERRAAFPPVNRVPSLSPKGFEDLMDLCTVLGFKDRRRPVLSLATRQALEAARVGLDVTDYRFRSELRGVGAADTIDLTGWTLMSILMWLERLGLDVDAFTAARRAVTTRQVKLLHLARKGVEIDDGTLYKALQLWGGVNSATDLDVRGFDLMMAYMAAQGFERRLLVATSEPGLDRRPGFATAAQLDLVRELWREWSGADDDGALNAWLERFHHVSTLRFLTAAAAGRVITALKAMKRRRRDDTAA